MALAQQRRLALAAVGAARRASLVPGSEAALAGGHLVRGTEAPQASFHSHTRPEQSASSAAAAAEPSLIPFPREGPGVSYALNWALASAGVTPQGEVTRNAKPASLASLAKQGAKVAKSSGSKVLVSGGKGEDALAPGQFKKLLKEVTAHLSALPTLYVQDGAVGSSSSCDARTRCICESPAAAAAMAAVLAPTPTRTVAAASFPLTLYAVPSYTNEALTPGAGFVAVDFASSLVIAAGSAVGDAAALRLALSAAAVGPIQKRGALLLPGRLVAPGGSKPFIVLAPTAAGDSLLASSAAWPDLGVVWGPSGTGRVFPAAASAPSQYLPPSALVLLTSDSTGALPAVSSLTPQQAAFHFLAGYDGTAFHPASARSPLSLGAGDALSLAQTLAGLISSTGTPAYLVNAHGQSDVGKLAAAAAAGSAPAAAPVSEDAVAQLKAKLEEGVKTRFPNLPEDIAP